MSAKNSLSLQRLSLQRLSLLSFLALPRRIGATMVAGLICVVLFASGCASSNDPSTWEEAIAQRTLEENFMRSCQEANTDANASSDLTSAQISTYCTCAFEKLSDHFADDLSSFTEAESRLRSDPQDIDPAVRALLLGCLPE